MVKYGRIELLSHSLCLKYLQAKWYAYGLWAHVFNLFVYVIFLFLLTSLVTEGVEKELRPSLLCTSRANALVHGLRLELHGKWTTPNTAEHCEVISPTFNASNSTNDSGWNGEVYRLRRDGSSKPYRIVAFILIGVITANMIKEFFQIYQQVR